MSKIPSQCRYTLFGAVCEAISSGKRFVRDCDKAIWVYPTLDTTLIKRVCKYYDDNNKHKIPRCKYNE